MDWSFLIKNKESLLVSTDTRNLPAGCVFFALHGANFDGNKFAKQALEQGAALAVIDNPEYALPDGTLLVPNTLVALQDLARAWRQYDSSYKKKKDNQVNQMHIVRFFGWFINRSSGVQTNAMLA